MLYVYMFVGEGLECLSTNLSGFNLNLRKKVRFLMCREVFHWFIVAFDLNVREKLKNPALVMEILFYHLLNPILKLKIIRLRWNQTGRGRRCFGRQLKRE
jgi:hypothetical protein